MLRRGFHVGESLVEVGTDYLVHTGEDAHHFAREESDRPVHDPVDAGGGALRFKHKVGGILAFKRFEEVELDGGLCGFDGEDLHASLTYFAVPFPLVDGADATGWA